MAHHNTRFLSCRFFLKADGFHVKGIDDMLELCDEYKDLDNISICADLL